MIIARNAHEDNLRLQEGVTPNRLRVSERWGPALQKSQRERTPRLSAIRGCPYPDAACCGSRPSPVSSLRELRTGEGNGSNGAELSCGARTCAPQERTARTGTGSGHSVRASERARRPDEEESSACEMASESLRRGRRERSERAGLSFHAGPVSGSAVGSNTAGRGGPQGSASIISPSSTASHSAAAIHE